MLAPMFLFIFDSPVQIVFVALIVFMLFGASRLPELAKSLGQSRKAFRDAMREAEEDNAADRARITSGPAAAPQLSQMSDEELMAEMRRRVESKQPE
jgi:sec-independent protein translocase protein TatA